MLKNIKRYEDKAFSEIPTIEKQASDLLKQDKKMEAARLLNQYCSDFAGATRQTWEEMEHLFWETFWSGF